MNNPRRNFNRGQNNSSRNPQQQYPGTFMVAVKHQDQYLSNVPVELKEDNQPPITLNTDAGKASFRGLNDGSRHNLKISFSGYKEYTASITPNNKNRQLIVTLEPKIHRVNFYVENEATQENLIGATVKMYRSTTAGRKLVDTATTCLNAGNGIGAILSLVNGEYIVEASMEGYLTSTATVDIVDNSDNEEVVVQIRKIPDKTVPLKILFTGDPIANGKMRLLFPGGSQDVDINNDAATPKMEVGKYTVLVDGYGVNSIDSVIGNKLMVEAGTREVKINVLRTINPQAVKTEPQVTFRVIDSEKNFVPAGSIVANLKVGGVNYSPTSIHDGAVVFSNVNHGKGGLFGVAESIEYYAGSKNCDINENNISFDIELKKKKPVGINTIPEVLIKILDSDTKDPIAGATVEVEYEGFNNRYTTNRLGTVTLLNVVLNKKVMVAITAPGYFTKLEEFEDLTAAKNTKSMTLDQVKTLVFNFYENNAGQTPIKIIPARKLPNRKIDEWVDTKISYRVNGVGPWIPVLDTYFCPQGGNSILIPMSQKGIWTLKIEECRGYSIAGKNYSVNVPLGKVSLDVYLDSLPKGNIMVILGVEKEVDGEKKFEELTDEKIRRLGGFRVVRAANSRGTMNPRIGDIDVATIGQIMNNCAVVTVDLPDESLYNKIPVFVMNIIPPKGYKNVPHLVIGTKITQSMTERHQNNAHIAKVALQSEKWQIPWRTMVYYSMPILLLLSVILNYHLCS